MFCGGVCRAKFLNREKSSKNLSRFVLCVLIAEAAMAIRSELTAKELGRTIHAHPTFGESWMEAAHALHGECIHAPPKRKK